MKKNENKMKKMKTQMMIECKNNKIEISRLWLPEILLMVDDENGSYNTYIHLYYPINWDYHHSFAGTPY